MPARVQRNHFSILAHAPTHTVTQHNSSLTHALGLGSVHAHYHTLINLVAQFHLRPPLSLDFPHKSYPVYPFRFMPLQLWVAARDSLLFSYFILVFHHTTHDQQEDVCRIYFPFSKPCSPLATLGDYNHRYSH